MKTCQQITSSLLILLILASGCKEDAIIGCGVAPGDNTLGATGIADTMTVITKTTYSGPVITSNRTEGLHIIQALGTITDPFFGTTNAGIYFQLLPPVKEFSFSQEPYVIDSAVLILPYSGFAWGNRTNPQPQKFRVYRVTEPMDIGTDYYSDHDMQLSSQLIGEQTVDLVSSLNDTPVIAGKNTGHKHLRILLSNSFRDEVYTKVNSGDLKTEADFLSYFKGFYIAPDSNTNFSNNADLLSYITLDGNTDYARLGIAFYYKENAEPSVTKVKFFSYFRDKTAHYNRISRNYSGYPAQDIMARYNSTINTADETVLLQNDPGAVIDVRIPHINTLPLATIVKAELVFTQVNSGVAADSLEMPPRIYLVGINANGEEYEIADYTSLNIDAAINFIDGAKRTEKDAAGHDVTRYRLNIPHELQKAIAEGRDELHLRVKSSRYLLFPAAYRLVASGRAHGSYRTQLNIVYSKPVN